MKLSHQCQRILILLLCLTVFAPVIFLSLNKNVTSTGGKEFIEDLSTIKYRADADKLNAIEQDDDREGLKEPQTVFYKDGDFSNVTSYSSLNELLDSDKSSISGGRNNLVEANETKDEIIGEKQQNKQNTLTSTLVVKENSNQSAVTREQNTGSKPRSFVDEKIKQLKDQIIRAKAYLSFAPPNSNSHLVKDLNLRLKELEQASVGANKDSDLSKSAMQKMKAMEDSLSKATHTYPDCSSMATKLRSMNYKAEEQVKAHIKQAAYLVELAGRTTPKGLHCLSMRLTADYFDLIPEQRVLPNQHRLENPNLYHYAVFSDNVLACAVVINSTVSTSLDSSKIVFHVVTDSLNLPAISMWFLLNPPGNATIHIQTIDKLKTVIDKFDPTLNQQNTHESRFNFVLNHLRFYLPDIFPTLDKIVLLDHDVVVQRDLTKLWSVDMNGKVNGAVETCRKSDSSYKQIDMFIDFQDPEVAKRFDANSCTWAFGMNLFDLREWRRRNISAIYRKYLQLGDERQLWKAGSLPLAWVTFYNQTLALDRRWHFLGLGYESDIELSRIERAAVIHYDGIMKPWLEIGIAKYKDYWGKYVNYNFPFLQQCNIHP